MSSMPLEEGVFCLAANSTEQILLSSEIALAIQDSVQSTSSKSHIKDVDSPETTSEVLASLKELCLEISHQLPAELVKKMIIHSILQRPAAPSALFWVCSTG
jgi:hypothetical protein